MKSLINVIRKGTGHKKLIFVHGNMASARWWQPVMSILEEECKMYAVNLRGFGDSPDTPPEISLADHAEDIYDLVNAHQLSNFVLIGHSLGGGVVMQFAAEHPELLAGIVLVSSAPIWGVKDVDYALLQALVNNPDFALSSLKGTFIKKPDETFLAELLSDAARGLNAVAPNTRALESADFTKIAPHFGKPVLIIHGAKDPLVPVTDSENFLRFYPNSTLKIIPDVGHHPQVESPAEFTSTIKDFLGSLRC